MFCQRNAHGVNALAESQGDSSHAAEKRPLQKSSKGSAAVMKINSIAL